MTTTITIKQLNENVRKFIKQVECYEHIKNIKNRVELCAINGFMTLSVTGEFYEYSIVFDAYDNCEMKGFATNPIINH